MKSTASQRFLQPLNVFLHLMYMISGTFTASNAHIMLSKSQKVREMPSLFWSPNLSALENRPKVPIARLNKLSDLTKSEKMLQASRICSKPMESL